MLHPRPRHRRRSGPGRRNPSQSFGALSATESQQLFEQAFDSKIAAMAADPGPLLEEADEVIEVRDKFTALVDPAGSDDRAMVISTAPIETPDGDLTDLGLERTVDAIQSEAPIAPSSCLLRPMRRQFLMTPRSALQTSIPRPPGCSRPRTAQSAWAPFIPTSWPTPT